jgi:hypothetical protein
MNAHPGKKNPSREARVRRARAVPAGRVAAALLGVGWVGAAVIWHSTLDVAISAAATWLVTVLFLLAAWELALMLAGARAVTLVAQNPWLRRLESGLVPVGLLAGLLFGHYLWT